MWLASLNPFYSAHDWTSTIILAVTDCLNRRELLVCLSSLVYSSVRKPQCFASKEKVSIAELVLTRQLSIVVSIDRALQIDTVSGIYGEGKLAAILHATPSLFIESDLTCTLSLAFLFRLSGLPCLWHNPERFVSVVGRLRASCTLSCSHLLGLWGHVASLEKPKVDLRLVLDLIDGHCVGFYLLEAGSLFSDFVCNCLRSERSNWVCRFYKSPHVVVAPFQIHIHFRDRVVCPLLQLFQHVGRHRDILICISACSPLLITRVHVSAVVVLILYVASCCSWRYESHQTLLIKLDYMWLQLILRLLLHGAFLVSDGTFAGFARLVLDLVFLNPILYFVNIGMQTSCLVQDNEFKLL